MTRPSRVVGIVAVNTDVGKTWCAVELIRVLRAAGRAVAVRKPVQSFVVGDDAARVTDAHLLAAAASCEPTEVCPAHRWLPLPLAPPMAADGCGAPRIGLVDLIDELRWPTRCDVGIVETVGGVRSPLAHDADSGDFVFAAAADVVVLVARPDLGAINDVRLSIAALAPASTSTPTTVLLNRFDPHNAMHVANRDWLRTVDNFDVVTSVSELAARW